MYVSYNYSLLTTSLNLANFDYVGMDFDAFFHKLLTAVSEKYFFQPRVE